MDLDDLFNRPRRLPFAGGTVRARRLSLHQLARLQSWIRGLLDDPAEAALVEASAAPPADRAAIAARGMALAGAWPPAIGTAGADAILSTPEGRRELWRVGLRGLNPGLDVAEADEASDAEWSAVGRALFGTDAAAALLRLLDGDGADAGGDGTDGPAPWGKIAVDVIDRTGWTLAEVGRRDLRQLAAVRHGGEVPGPALRPREGETMDDARARRMDALGIADVDHSVPADDPALGAELAAIAAAMGGA